MFEYIPVFNHLSCKAGFTLLNPEYVDDEARIQGLNLGSNQLEDSNVIKRNRDRFFESIGIKVDTICSLKQIHSAKLVNIHKAGLHVEEADALTTSHKNLCLLIQTADCAPVLVFDPIQQRSAAVHAGWRGAVADILKISLKHFIVSGSDINDLNVAIGPCISHKNFEVGKEVAEKFSPKYVSTDFGLKPHVNLRAFLMDQAISMGVNKSQITDIDLCTIDNESMCYSHRRQGDMAGRMGAFITIN